MPSKQEDNHPTEDLVPPSPVSSKSPTDEAILALAQGIANEHKTKLSGATALEELEYVLDQLGVHEPTDPEYELWQYLNGRSTDTKAAALALAQYVQGGGGGNTVKLDIMEAADAPLSTAYFTVENSSGTQLTITPVTEDDFHYFTITANVGELLTFKTVDGSGYGFSSNTKYVMNEDQTNMNTYPLDFSMTQVQIVAANDPSAVAPHPYLMLVLNTVN